MHEFETFFIFPLVIKKQKNLRSLHLRVGNFKKWLSVTLMFGVMLMPIIAPAVSDYSKAQFRLISPQDSVTDISRIIKQYTPVPTNGTTYMNVRHMGDPYTAELENEVANAITWDASAFTGFRPPDPISNWQR